MLEIGNAQAEMMQFDANTEAIDEHVRGFAAQQEELEADVERSEWLQTRNVFVALCLSCFYFSRQNGAQGAQRKSKASCGRR